MIGSVSWVKSLRLSGQIECQLKRRDEIKLTSDYWSRLTGFIGESRKMRWEKRGLLYFSGGAIYTIQMPQIEGQFVNLAFRFQKTTPDFLDSLFKAATREVKVCKISCSIRSKELDFDWIKYSMRATRSRIRETAEGNISGQIKINGQAIHIAAFPKIGIANLSGDFERRRGVPSAMLAKLLKRKPDR